MKSAQNQHAVFLDRDGTIMEDANYVGNVDHVVLIAGAPKALKRLQDAGYRLFIVTNQSGVGRGYFTREAVEDIHAHLDQQFGQAGVKFDRYYVCPHHPEDKCDCRKPNPRFLREAAGEFGLDLTRCFMIGDRSSDIQAGTNAGAKTILVLTGVGRETLAKKEVRPDYIASDLGEAAGWILNPAAQTERSSGTLAL
jgi:D-glycero-D-manno-heptose 1,7-bisphosphate phosphatase